MTQESLEKIVGQMEGLLDTPTLEELNKSTDTEKFVNNIIASESAALLASMGFAAAALLGGSKRKKRRTKKHRRTSV